MDELCPLCLKIGTKTKIKGVQLNLTEALWMCENEACPWPFGYETPSIFLRRIGEKWSFEWQGYRKLQKTVGPIPVSTELSLYTPPVTPSGDAAAKHSPKADNSDATSITDSTGDSNIFTINSVPGDSYAPRTVDNVASVPKECAGIAEQRSTDPKVVPSEFSDPGTVAQAPSFLPSIFDIDGDESLLSNKIAAGQCLDRRSKDSVDSGSSASVALDVESPERVNDSGDTVLKKSLNSETTIDKSQLETKRNVVVASVNTDRMKKISFVRSIARTNIDLQRYTPSSVERNETIDAVERTQRPATPPSELDDRTNVHKQHTTTINVKGIPPITLSYDLADLSKKSATAVPLTSTPMQKRVKRNFVALRDNANEGRTIITTELPKKLAKVVATRRTVRQYEKFSFSALRKNVPETRESNDDATASINENDATNEGTNLRKVDSSSFESRLQFRSAASGINAKNIGTNDADSNETDRTNRTTESSHREPNGSLANDSHTDDSLNLNCLLDDMLLDGYQNATQNLNDDWLESFFT